MKKALQALATYGEACRREYKCNTYWRDDNNIYRIQRRNRGDDTWDVWHYGTRREDGTWVETFGVPVRKDVPWAEVHSWKHEIDPKEFHAPNQYGWVEAFYKLKPAEDGWK